MRHLALGVILGLAMGLVWPALTADDGNTKEAGVEWVNQYNGTNPNLSACDDDAVGFYNTIAGKGFTKVFNWGDNNAFEQDFKTAPAPGGGDDANWVDNVDFAYFAGHGGSTGIYFGANHDDLKLANTDAVWGDKDLEWIVLSACSCLAWDSGTWTRWGWPVFKGLHLIMGMHTSMSDTPDAGTYFVRFMTGDPAYPSYGSKVPIREAWRQACWWSLPSSQYCAIMGATGAGGDPWNEYLPGYGAGVADSPSPTGLWYVKYPCG